MCWTKQGIWLVSHLNRPITSAVIGPYTLIGNLSGKVWPKKCNSFGIIRLFKLLIGIEKWHRCDVWMYLGCALILQFHKCVHYNTANNPNKSRSTMFDILHFSKNNFSLEEIIIMTCNFSILSESSNLIKQLNCPSSTRASSKLTLSKNFSHSKKWWKKHERKVFQKIPAFMTIGTYLWYRKD